MDNTVEIGRADLINIGGSVYLRIPPTLRQKPAFTVGQQVTLHQEPGSDDIIVRKEKTASDG